MKRVDSGKCRASDVTEPGAVAAGDGFFDRLQVGNGAFVPGKFPDADTMLQSTGVGAANVVSDQAAGQRIEDRPAYGSQGSAPFSPAAAGAPEPSKTATATSAAIFRYADGAGDAPVQPAANGRSPADRPEARRISSSMAGFSAGNSSYPGSANASTDA